MGDKSEKEAFVSGLTGTSVWEIGLVVQLFPIGIIVSDVVNSTLKSGFVGEFVFVVVVPLLAMTWLADSLMVVYGWMGLVWALFAVIRKPSHFTNKKKNAVVLNKGYGLYHVTGFRAGLLLLTAMAILAVDFHVFPRRFGKTETFGTGLMDIGVGAFVVSNAIVYKDNHVFRLWNIIPLLVLGFVRLAMVKGIEYQEHASEYGVHWNFFFTLAMVSLISGTMLQFPFVLDNVGVIGFLVGVIYQLGLANGLENWVLNIPRTDLLTQNKEGIVSIIGYLSLFLLGVWLRNLHNNTKKPRYAEWHLFLYYLLNVALYISIVLTGPISRRLANLSYIIWVLATSQQLLVSFVLLQQKPSPFGIAKPNLIAEAVNKNQLFVFLLANLLTGVVNVSIKTLKKNDTEAVMILLGYILVVTGVPVVLYQSNIKIRL